MRQAKILLFVCAGVFLLALPQTVMADPVLWSANGHYYEIVATALQWPDARVAADDMTYLGALGHLATITSPEEQSFLQETFGTQMDNCWLGGYQDPTNSAPAENWHWVTGEPWMYTNWRPAGLVGPSAEPNDAGGAEFYLEVHGGANQTWNDLGAGWAWHFLVEYEQLPTSSQTMSMGQLKAKYATPAVGK